MKESVRERLKESRRRRILKLLEPLSPTSRILHAYLQIESRYRQNPLTENLQPSYTEIEQLSGVSERVVPDYLRILKSAGLIKKSSTNPNNKKES